MKLNLAPAFGLAALVAELALAPQAIAGQLSYRFAVVDATAGNRLSPASIQVVMDGDETDLALSGTVAVAARTVPPKEINVSISAGDKFRARKISVLPQGLKTTGINQFSLEQRPTRFTKQYLLGGINRLESGEIDRGLALFEQAFHGDDERKVSPVLDDYEVILRFNYARGLQQACLKLFYETCLDARTRLQDILSEMDHNSAARIYSSNRVQRELIQKALADLRIQELQARYLLAMEHKSAGRYADAQAILNGLKQDLTKDQAAFSANDHLRLTADLTYISTLIGNKK